MYHRIIQLKAGDLCGSWPTNAFFRLICVLCLPLYVFSRDREARMILQLLYYTVKFNRAVAKHTLSAQADSRLDGGCAILLFKNYDLQCMHFWLGPTPNRNHSPTDPTENS